MIISVDELKEHLRLQHEDEDEYIESLLSMAEAAAADFCLTQWSDSAPEPVRLAVMLMASHYYEYRDSPDRFALRAMRMSFEALLWPYRDVAKLF